MKPLGETISKIYAPITTLSSITVAIVAVIGLDLARDVALAPRAPTNLTGEYLDDLRKLLEWDYAFPVDGIRGFIVLQRRVGIEQPGEFTEIAEVEITSTSSHSYTADQCPGSQHCVYRIVAVSKNGNQGPRSNYVRCEDDSTLLRCVYDPE